MVLAGLAACGTDKKIVNYDPPPQPPLNGQLTLNVADSAMKEDQPQLALQVTAALLAKNPNDAQAWQRQGDAYFALNDISKAEAAYQKALAALSAAKAPGSNDGLGGFPLTGGGSSTSQREVIQAVKIGLGRIQLASNPAAAEARFADIVATDPQNAIALNNLGIARDLQGNHAGAQEVYRKILAASPDNLAAKINLGLSLALSGDSNAAIALLGPLASRSDATPRMRQDYAVALAMGGHTEDAQKVLQTDMTAAQAAAVVAGYRQAPGTTPPQVSVN